MRCVVELRLNYLQLVTYVLTVRMWEVELSYTIFTRIEPAGSFTFIPFGMRVVREGGIYSRAASIRGRHLFEGGSHSLSIMIAGMFFFSLLLTEAHFGTTVVSRPHVKTSYKWQIKNKKANSTTIQLDYQVLCTSE